MKSHLRTVGLMALLNYITFADIPNQKVSTQTKDPKQRKVLTTTPTLQQEIKSWNAAVDEKKAAKKS